MHILHDSQVDFRKIPVFILTYIGIDYFLEWSSKIEHKEQIQFIIVDNGRQIIPPNIQYPVYQTSQNIGCAGGWNLISRLGFEYYNLDKIIIGQDDAVFTSDIVSRIWDITNDDTLVGAYDRSFEFSLFGITKNFWNTVGMFDENFIYVGCEDNDYKHRIRLAAKSIKSLGASADLNSSMTSKYITSVARPANDYNVQYINQKWGNAYQYTIPFDGATSQTIHSGLVDVYGDIEVFPSITEYNNYEHSIS